LVFFFAAFNADKLFNALLAQPVLKLFVCPYSTVAKAAL
jgi:hypothetical protein